MITSFFPAVCDVTVDVPPLDDDDDDDDDDAFGVIHVQGTPEMETFSKVDNERLGIGAVESSILRYLTSFAAVRLCMKVYMQFSRVCVCVCLAERKYIHIIILHFVCTLHAPA